MLRSCLRAVEAISRIPGVNACEPWRNFMQVQDHAVKPTHKHGGNSTATPTADTQHVTVSHTTAPHPPLTNMCCYGDM